MTLQQVVILAGGTGERFKLSSTLPKPLIDVFGSSQIAWALKGARISYPGARFFIAARSGLIDKIENSIEFDFPGIITEYVDVGVSTSGAAETLYRFLKSSALVNLASPLVSCDNDCFNLIEDSRPGNFLTCVSSDNPGHCFILTDENNNILELHEKSRVSSLAVSGNYGFAEARNFLDYYMKSKFEGKEKFISSIVSEMLHQGKKFRLSRTTEYFSLGTPDEIEILDKRIQNFS